MNTLFTCKHCHRRWSPLLPRGGRKPIGWRCCPSCGTTHTAWELGAQASAEAAAAAASGITNAAEAPRFQSRLELMQQEFEEQQQREAQQ
jgi:hypothetical protein